MTDQQYELTDEDKEEINALAAVIIAKVMDEVAPDSEMISTSNLALGALACKWAGKQLEMTAIKQS